MTFCDWNTIPFFFLIDQNRYKPMFNLNIFDLYKRITYLAIYCKISWLIAIK